MRLTGSEARLAEILTRKLRLVDDHLAAKLLGCPRSAVRRLLRGLAKCGLVEARAAMARRVPVDSPLAEWTQGGPVPKAARVCWLARKRYLGSVPERTTVFLATQRLTALVGGVAPKDVKADHVSHDLGVGAALALLARKDEKIYASWIGEELLSRSDDFCGFGRKCPDGLCLVRGEPTVIDYLGHYDIFRVVDTIEFWTWAATAFLFF